jgi:hypothetical protein
MSDIAQAILYQLANTSGVTDLIANRIYPNYDLQSDRQYPNAVYTIDSSPVLAFDGPSGMNDGTLRIHVFSTTYSQTAQVAQAVVAALEFQSGTWVGVEVQGVFLLDENGIQDFVVTEPTTEEVLFHGKTVTFELRYLS